MTIKASDITSLIELFSSSGWDELHVEVEGLHLYLSTNPHAHAPGGVSPAAGTPPASSRPAPIVAPPAPTSGGGAQHKTGPAAAAHADVPAHWVAVKAPNLGTFYRAPKPGAEPFVAVGQTIHADAEVCLLEVMKLFTAVRAGVAGVVRRICVNDSEMVEHDQVLMYVEPA
jgi:acetyl-CoA carboxylase biotin carboxyl carrier protein